MLSQNYHTGIAKNKAPVSKAWRHFPSSDILLPWVEDMRSQYGYHSMNPVFLQKSKLLERQFEGPVHSEEGVINRSCETVIGMLIQDYLSRAYPQADFFFASKFDDYTGTDFLIRIPEISPTWIRTDLSLSTTSISGFQDIELIDGIRKKKENFEKYDSIPEEFFASVLCMETPRPLPTIILRLNGPIINAFIRYFFSLPDSSRGLLEVFRECIKVQTNYNDRIAYILGLQKSHMPREEYEDLAKITELLGTLFAGVENVEVSHESPHIFSWNHT